jgi:hypothetical protein
MTQLPSDKFNIAWFKLAELVLRKEKERALYIYRLLVHSLQDEAVAAQLEGDLLFSFNDEKSLDCYIRAARLYERSDRCVEAIFIYEHLNSLRAPEFNNQLVHLYQRTGNFKKAYYYQQPEKTMQQDGKNLSAL